MKRCSYLAWWLWLEVKQGEALERCPDGPHCGCDQHSPDDEE